MRTQSLPLAGLAVGFFLPVMSVIYPSEPCVPKPLTDTGAGGHNGSEVRLIFAVAAWLKEVLEQPLAPPDV